MDEKLHIYITVGVGAVILFWMLSVYLVSRISGWWQLAKRYRAIGPADGESFNWASARFSWFSNYKHCLNITVSSNGIHLQPVYMFRRGHEPLFLPWDAIKDLQQSDAWLYSSTQIVIGSNLDDWTKTITLYGKALGESIKKHAPTRLTMNLV